MEVKTLWGQKNTNLVDGDDYLLRRASNIQNLLKKKPQYGWISLQKASMRSSHGVEEEDEVSFSIWARVGMDQRGRNKKKMKKKKKGNPSLVGATLLQKKHEQEKGKRGKSSLYIESDDGSHN